MLSAVTASVVWRAAFGNQPVLALPLFSLVHPGELLFTIALGLLAAVVTLAFVRTLYWVEDRSDGLRVPDDIKPAVGATLLGLLGLTTL